MTVLEAYQQYKSIRKVAKLLHMSRRTVAKYLKDPRPRRYGPRPPRPSKLAPFYGYLHEQMARGVFNASRLYQELRAMGYTGGKTILKDYLKPFRPPRAPKAALRYEVGPGEQAQVDLAEVRYSDETGQAHRLYVFVMVLSYSRLIFVEFIRRADLPTFLRCHIHAFEFFGGVPRRILYDRTKLAVFGVDANGQPVWQQRFGPVWLNINWMVSLGLQQYGYHELAGQVWRHVLTQVDRSGFREYYDPLTGAGLGGRDFSWSAAVVLWGQRQGDRSGHAQRGPECRGIGELGDASRLR